MELQGIGWEAVSRDFGAECWFLPGRWSLPGGILRVVGAAK